MTEKRNLMDIESIREHVADVIETALSQIRHEGKNPARFGRGVSLHVIDKTMTEARTVADFAEEIGAISINEYLRYSDELLGAYYEARRLINLNTEG